MTANGTVNILVVEDDPVDFEAHVLEGDDGVEAATRVARLERSALNRRLARAGVFGLKECF